MAEEKVNPYKSEDGTPRLRHSVSAFIDILGYRDYIKSSFKSGNAEKELIRLRTALDTAYFDLKERSKRQDLTGALDFQVRSFTDSLIIGNPIPEHGSASNQLQMLVFYIGFLQAELAGQGYFIRGAMSVGDLYVDDDIVFGPALLEAYEAEQQLAIYPRVILCESAEKAFQEISHERKIPDLLIDSDNRVFVDYLDSTVMIAYPDDRPFTEFLEGHKKSITEKLNEFATNRHIRAKYEWSATYHNAFCNFYPDLFGDEDKISDGLLTPGPQPWIVRPSKSE